MGSLPTRINDQGETPADRMIERFDLFDGYRELRQRQGTVDICSDLLNARGFMTHMALDWRHRPTWFNPHYDMDRVDGRMSNHIFEDNTFRLIWQISDEKETQGMSLATIEVEQKISLNPDIDLPEELLPLVYRSSDHLISLLKKGIDLQNWVDSYTRWPSGLALLFESGNTPSENSLRSACEASCIESITLLINTRGCYIGPKELQTACNHHTAAIMEQVVHALVDRRRRLQILAETHLPEEVVLELGIRAGTLMNLQAYKAYELLKAGGIDVESLQERERWSVYDYIGFNLKSADLLWNSGFHDVDEANDNETCLMKIWRNTPPCSLEEFLAKADWLVKKGASIICRNGSFPALHFLGHGVGKLLHSIGDSEDFSLQLQCLNQNCIDLMRTIFLDDTQDCCCCPCSSTGCSGLTALLRGMFPTRSRGDFQELIHRLAIVLETLTSSHELGSQESFINIIVPGVLRFVTCRCLDISHTCIREFRKEIDAEEIEEIQDEERLLIKELEDLLREFVAALGNLSLSLSDFLTVYWWDRMHEVQISCEASAEAITRIREAGVILDGHGVGI